MSDLIERLIELAKKRCERHNAADPYTPSWNKKPKDFLEWQAAAELRRLHARIEELEDKLRHSDRKEIEACYRRIAELEKTDD